MINNGTFRNFSDFGWNASLSQSTQTQKVQSAFDSGEPLLMPIMQTVSIDQPLILSHPTMLLGSGGDITQGAVANSQFRTQTMNMDVLLVRSNHVKLNNFNVHIDGGSGGQVSTGRAIVIGDGTATVAGVEVSRVSTDGVCGQGIGVLGMTKSHILNNWLRGWTAALSLENRVSADQGDNFVYGNTFSSDGPNGTGLYWKSGGGLHSGLNKYNNTGGLNHIYIDWSQGGSGVGHFVGDSYETCTGISVDIRGNQQFKSMKFIGCRWACNSVCVAVRNFGSTFAWLEDLLIEGSQMSGGNANAPIIDIGYTQDAMLVNNTLRGNGVAVNGIIIHPQADGTCYALLNILGCTGAKIVDTGVGSKALTNF